MSFAFADIYLYSSTLIRRRRET